MVSRPRCSVPSSRGATLVEVLVSIVIVVFGLLGLAGLQVRLQASELESYQRSQALLLLNDMVQRMTVNRNNIAQYLTPASDPLGVGEACPALGGTPTTADRDLKEWCEALTGTAEREISGGVTRDAGHMVGGRGCIEDIGGGDYMVTVAWQGFTPISAPPASVACGAAAYNGPAGSACKNDLCRRVVTSIVRIGSL